MGDKFLTAEHRFHIQNPIERVGDDAAGDHRSRNFGHEAPNATSVDGESFAGCLDDGCKYESFSSIGPFARSMDYIAKRREKILDEGNGNYRPYDETNTVNQS